MLKTGIQKQKRVKQDFPRLNSYRYFIIGMYIIVEIFIFLVYRQLFTFALLKTTGPPRSLFFNYSYTKCVFNFQFEKSIIKYVFLNYHYYYCNNKRYIAYDYMKNHYNYIFVILCFQPVARYIIIIIIIIIIVTITDTQHMII